MQPPQFSAGKPLRCPHDGSNSAGKIKSFFLTRSLAGWSPGLKGATGQFIEVWFVRLLLGHIDQNNLSFLRADIAPQQAGQNNEKS
jgi:hypothetical protein